MVILINELHNRMRPKRTTRYATGGSLRRRNRNNSSANGGSGGMRNSISRRPPGPGREISQSSTYKFGSEEYGTSVSTNMV